MKSTKFKPVKKDLYSDEDDLISSALRCLEARLKYMLDTPLQSSTNVRNYLQLQLAPEKSEMFSVLFMDSHFRLLAFDKMFRGSIHEAVVYPRCVLQKALEYNAARIIIAHNHPSGALRPSDADIKLTNDLVNILKVVDIKLVDHIIVGAQGTYSFAESGLLS
jgi:DNA repair protein RadC